MEPGHLLVEIGTEAPELFFLAQLACLQDLVEPGCERLVVRLRREVPIASARGSEDAVTEIIAGARFLLARLHLLSRFTVGVLILGIFAAHLDVAAAWGALVSLLGRVVASGILVLGVVPGSVWFFLRRLFCGGEVEILEQASRQLGERCLIFEGERKRVELRRRF